MCWPIFIIFPSHHLNFKIYFFLQENSHWFIFRLLKDQPAHLVITLTSPQEQVCSNGVEIPILSLWPLLCCHGSHPPQGTEQRRVLTQAARGPTSELCDPQESQEALSQTNSPKESVMELKVFQFITFGILLTMEIIVSLTILENYKRKLNNS